MIRHIFSPQNNIIVQFEKKYYDSITFKSGIILFKDTGFHPEESAMLEARVISVPPCIINRPDYFGFTELPQPGDTILVRYDVIFSYKEQPDRSTPIYSNVFYYNGEEYWKVDIQQVFAVKHENSYRMLNGYVMCEHVIEEQRFGSLAVPDHIKLIENPQKMKIRSIVHEELHAGDIIYCQPNVAQRYTIDEDSFCIIKQSHIFACAI